VEDDRYAGRSQGRRRPRHGRSPCSPVAGPQGTRPQGAGTGLRVGPAAD